MDLVTLCPLVTSKLVWQAHSGAFALTVIVKATFVLKPGTSTLASEQEPIIERPQFYDGDPRCGVRVPCDVVPYKPRADLLLVGRAYARDHVSRHNLVTRFIVGDMHKSIEMRYDGSSIWPGRTQGFGGISASSLDDGWNNKPLPRSFDPRVFQSAPIDQQRAEIRADERITLENLHPAHQHFVTALPNLHPRAIADRATGEREEIRLIGDTLWVDTDRSVCCVVWRGRMGLRSRDEPGRIAVWVDGMPLMESVLPRKTDLMIDNVDAGATMIGVVGSGAAPALPFVEGASKLALTNRSLAFDIARWVDEKNEQTGHGDDGTGTMFVSAKMLPREALPFGHKVTDFGATEPQPSDVLVKPALEDKPPHVDVPMLGYYETKSTVGGVSSEDTGREPSNRVVDIAPPAMIGPIVCGLVKDDAPIVVAFDETVAGIVDKPVVEDKAPAVELTIEQTASIAAELAEGNVERGRVLHAHELLEPAWRENATRWDAAMSAEQRQGQTTLRGTYDAAYVQRVEAFRGPITVQEYATLCVSFERRTCDTTLSVLRIQPPALMPIMRVWAKKVASDVGLGKEANAAIRTARRA